MLAIRPICGYCAKDLPPNDIEAKICSYECTFCLDRVEHVLGNVCPNCGGGFMPRPIRPVTEWRPGVSLAKHPATNKRVRQPVVPETQVTLLAAVGDLPLEKR